MQLTNILATTLAFLAITNAIPVDPTLDAREVSPKPTPTLSPSINHHDLTTSKLQIQLLQSRSADPNLFGAIAKIATKLKPGKSAPAWKPDLSKVMLGQKTKDRLRLNGPSRI